MAKIKEEAEDGGEEDGKSSDPWEDTESAEGDENDEGTSHEYRSTHSETSHDHNKRFHAAFHAKKQSRLDQRRRITQKPVHEAHTEL